MTEEELFFTAKQAKELTSQNKQRCTDALNEMRHQEVMDILKTIKQVAASGGSEQVFRSRYNGTLDRLRELGYKISPPCSPEGHVKISW